MDDGMWATVENALKPIPAIHEVAILAFRLGPGGDFES
jgi:hypothetical protein